MACRCGCFDGLSRLSQGSQLPKPVPSPLALDEAALQLPELDDPQSPITRQFSSTPPSPVAARKKADGAKAEVPLWQNGFRTRPEIESISVSEANKAPYSLPQEALVHQPQRKQMIATFKNGDWERMVHCNTPLGDEETTQLNELQTLAERQGLSFMPSVSIAATRCIGDARGDIPLALKKMRDSQSWREKFFSQGPILDEEVASDLAHGVIYFAARDFALRPTIFIRAARTPQCFKSEEAIPRLKRLVIFCLEYFTRYLAVPGKVENVCVVVDLKGAGYMPFRILRELGEMLSQQHAARVWRFYICNMPLLLNALSKLLQTTAMTDRQVEKIIFVKDLAVLHQDFALHQLETDLGGTRPIIDKFFPFPMQCGPFESGCRTGPDPNAIKDVHRALTEEGARGRLWDAANSLEENTGLEYTDEAPEIFRRCGFEMPVSSLEDDVSVSALGRFAGSSRHEVAMAPHAISDGTTRAPAAKERLEATWQVEIGSENLKSPNLDLDPAQSPAKLVEDAVTVEYQEICRPQVLSCVFCRCTVGITKRGSPEGTQ